MDQGYWRTTLGQRLSRRRALAATGGLGLGAALLAACGGSDSGGKSDSKATPQAVSSLIAQQKDTTKDAKKGGTLKFTVPGDIPNFDAHILSFTDAQQVLLNFSRLTRVKPGVLQPSDGTVIGDAMESWEFSPDKLTLTMKVRANLGTPMVAPVNGRNLDATDIAYSWDRWAKTGTNRSELVNAVKPGAPVLSLTAPDPKTIVIKLKEPVASILTSFSNQASGWLFVYPKEAESGFDMRRTPIGSGVYYLSDYAPSTRFVYSRNPNFYDKNTAFADKIEVPIITEYAQGVSQLKAGNLHWYAVTAEDVLQTKKDVPEINMYQTDPATLGITSFFGFQPGNGTPFRDVRLRQAWSKSLDRDLYLNTWGNVDKFKAGGVDVPTYWNAALPQTAFKGWWLDPQSKDFGANASFFKHDLAESKKLMAAAGFANGITVASNYVGPEGYGPVTLKHIDVLEGMAAEAGFKFEKHQQVYAGNWMPEFRDSHGYFDGVAYRLTPYPADPGDALYSAYNKNGGIYYGFDADGKGTPKGQPFTGDPTCEDLTNKMRTDFDDAKRKQYGQDLQRYLGKMMYQLDSLGAAPGFNLVQPAVKNWLTHHTADWGQYWPTFWIDDSAAKKTP